MATEHSTFEIEIKTPVDLSGAQALEASLSKQRIQAQFLGKDIAELDAQLARIRGSISDYAAKNGDASRQVDKHVVSNRQLHRIIHSLNEAVPGLGMIFQATFSPIGAAIAIGTTALSYFQEELRKWNEEMDKASEEAAKPMTNRLELMREATVSNAVALEEFKIKLEDAARGEQNLAQQLSATIAKIHEQASSTGSIEDSLKNNELAGLEMFQKMGLVSTQEYEEKKFAIEEEFAAKKRKLDEETIQMEISARNLQLATSKMNQGALETVAKDKMKSASDAEINAQSAGDQVAKTKENAEAAKVKLNEFEKQNPKWTPLFERAKKELGRGASDDDIGMWFATEGREQMKIPGVSPALATDEYNKWLSLDIDKEQKNKLSEQATNEAAKTATEAARKKHDAEQAQKRADENGKNITDQQLEIENKNRDYKIKQQTNQQITALEHDTHQKVLTGNAAQRAAGYAAQENLTPDQARDQAYIQQHYGGQIQVAATPSVAADAIQLAELQRRREGEINPQRAQQLDQQINQTGQNLAAVEQHVPGMSSLNDRIIKLAQGIVGSVQGQSNQIAALETQIRTLQKQANTTSGGRY
jgi:hypothetical protein